jgi:hypothetical protein
MRIHARLCYKFGTPSLLSALALLAALAINVHASAQKIITFDAPNTGTGWQQGTFPIGINLEGVITGNVIDNGNGEHGFVRYTNGSITNFDVPGSDPVAYCTCPTGINDFGFITGYWGGTDQVNHGFIRLPNGKFITFDDPEAGTAQYQGTTPLAINSVGAVVGWYFDSNWATHGFLRSADGKFTTIDDTAGGVSTTPTSISDYGIIAGTVLDANNVSHGFYRTLDGKITTFDVPAAVGGSIGTYSAYINDLGVISGNYNDAVTNVYVGYLYSTEGKKFTTYSPPQAGTYPYIGTPRVTQATVIFPATTGCIVDNNYIAYPFLRDAGGASITFEVPGQWLTPGWDKGACGIGINFYREIVGFMADSNGAWHGWVRTPK